MGENACWVEGHRDHLLTIFQTCTADTFRLELWPGFLTSILQYERSVMLGLDISHKILRMDTVYDFLNDLYNEDRSRFRETATKKLVGEIVLTR